MRYIFCVLAIIATMGTVAYAAPINKVVAVVNGDMVTEYDLNRLSAPILMRSGIDPKQSFNATAVDKIRREVLNSYIQDLIVAQEAERLNVKVDESEIDATIAEIRKKAQLTETQFEQQLIAQKTTLNEFRAQVRKNLLNRNLLSHMVARKVVITHEEIEEYYKSHSDLFAAGRKVHIAMIVYPDGYNTVETAKGLKEGKLSFTDTVAKISVGPMKEQGGDLGIMAWSDVAPALRELISTMSEGDVSDVFNFNGLPAQLMLIENLTGDDAMIPLEQVSAQIENTLREPKMRERFTEYMEQLKKRAVIDIRL